MRAGGGHVDGERRNAVRRQRADRRDRLNAGLEGGHTANLSRGAHASVICQERWGGGGGGEGQRPSWEGLGQLPGNVRKSQCHSPMPGVSEVG